MTFINTDGMAFIGRLGVVLDSRERRRPGGHLPRDLPAAPPRPKRNAFEQNGRIANDWDSEPLVRHRLEILVALKGGGSASMASCCR